MPLCPAIFLITANTNKFTKDDPVKNMQPARHYADIGTNFDLDVHVIANTNQIPGRFKMQAIPWYSGRFLVALSGAVVRGLGIMTFANSFFLSSTFMDPRE